MTGDAVIRNENELRMLREEVRVLCGLVRQYIESPRVENFFIISEYVEGDKIMGDKPQTDASVHVEGSIGALAQTGAIQVINSIVQNLAPLEREPTTRAIGAALRQIAEAIAESPGIPSERERKRLLEDVDELAVQAARPEAAREKGVFGPIIDRIAAVCGGLGGLATVWSVAGPQITSFFAG